MADFQIIEYLADDVVFYPRSFPPLCKDFHGRRQIAHVDFEVPVGRCRIGGPLVDFPAGKALPEDMYFVALLDLRKVAPFDPHTLLPQGGFLIFFLGSDGDSGLTIYVDGDESTLERHVVEHDSWFYDGCLIKESRKSEEDWIDRYEIDEDDKEVWDHFGGFELTKTYGIYSDCQRDEAWVREITSSSKVLLLQVGTRFTIEGVWNVLIEEEDLRLRRFDRCTYAWSQS